MFKPGNMLSSSSETSKRLTCPKRLEFIITGVLLIEDRDSGTWAGVEETRLGGEITGDESMGCGFGDVESDNNYVSDWPLSRP